MIKSTSSSSLIYRLIIYLQWDSNFTVICVCPTVKKGMKPHDSVSPDTQMACVLYDMNAVFKQKFLIETM